VNPKVLAAIAALSVASVGVVEGLDQNRPELRLRVAADAGLDSACVIPDCRTFLGRGAWDDKHAPVDCTVTDPFTDGGTRWAGCNVTRAELAHGAACLPSRCTVIAGEDPLEVLP
jgi:hypothetical protein